jgi:hypothetical protein
MKLLMSIIDGHDPHLVIRRYGEPVTVRVYLYEVRVLWRRCGPWRLGWPGNLPGERQAMNAPIWYAAGSLNEGEGEGLW